MAMYAKVRRMRLREGLSISEIARRTSLSRNTIKDWLRGPVREAMRYQRAAAPKKIGPYEAVLREALATDARRPRRERRTALKLYAQLQAQGFSGSYARVTECIRAWRAAQGAGSARAAFVPLSFAWGEAFQFDWSDEGVAIGGVWRKVQLAHMKLCASRAFWLVAYPSQGHEMLFDAHTRSFQALGGVTRRGIYDNMKTAVDKVKRGKGRVVNARFAAMCSHYLFDADFCNVASGWEKGVVEKNVQDSRRRIWIEAGTRRFGSFIELNAWLGERCRSIWMETEHPEHKQFTVAEMLELEREQLMSMPEPFDGYVEKPARVSSTCLVSVARNRYSVPCEWAGHMVSTRLYPNRVDVAAGDTLVASHARLSNSGHTTYDWQHYIDLVQRKPGALRNGAPFLDLPAPLLRLRQSLLRHAGGDRVMAQVLAVVPQAGLEAVIVAVDLVLEGAAPSGSISVEHVRNVLARLNTPETPEQAETALQLTEAPKADTARYDRLRPTHQDGQEVSHA